MEISLLISITLQWAPTVIHGILIIQIRILHLTSNEVNPSFEFPEEGVYTVRLEATRDSDGCTAIAEKTITVSNTALVPDFDVVLSSCEMGDFVELIDQSYDSTGISVPVAWEWEININGNVTNF